MSNTRMSQVEATQSTEGIGARQSARDTLRDAAKRLRHRADGLDSIADALERCVPVATDGREGHPHIGVGSSAEIALWELAISIR